MKDRQWIITANTGVDTPEELVLSVDRDIIDREAIIATFKRIAVKHPEFNFKLYMQANITTRVEV